MIRRFAAVVVALAALGFTGFALGAFSHTASISLTSHSADHST
jgi:hypothetical protein